MLNQSEPLEPPSYLSASSISTWKQCKLKYKYSRLDKIPEETSEALLMGSFVHEVLEHLYTRQPEERNLINAKAISSYVWTKSNWAEQIQQVLKDEDQIRQFRWNSWWCIENLWAVENPQLIEPAGIETEVNGIIGENVPVKGFVDRYSITDKGALKIVDYKTGKSPRNPAWLKDKWYQLAIYGILLEKQLEKPIEEFELLFLKEAVKFNQRPKESDISKIINDIQEVYEEILNACKTVEFPPTPTKLCPWCSFQKICPAFSK